MRVRRILPWATLGAACACAALLVTAVVQLDRLGHNLGVLRAEVRAAGRDAQSAEGKSVSIPVAPDDPSLGPADAPTTLIMLMDFECQYCAGFFRDTLPKLVERYTTPGTVRIVFKYYPLPKHANATAAARAAESARQQGRFWDMAKLLYEKQAGLARVRYPELARGLGLDVAAFEACFASADTLARVSRDADAARDAGIRGTPALVINGRLYMGARSLDELVGLLDAPADPALMAPKDAYALLKDPGSGAVFVDVRTEEEFAAGHLQGALSIDVRRDDFRTRVSALPKTARYVVYCRSGARSAKAVEIMKAVGFTDCADMSGGTTAWTAAGLPLTR